MTGFKNIFREMYIKHVFGLFSLMIVCLSGVAAPLTWDEIPAGRTVDFENDILPVFKRNCLACHNTTKSRGELNLETPALIRQGGSSGDVVVPGEPDRSFLFITAAHLDEDSIMPPAGNKVKAGNLTPAELGLLRAWITQGASGTVSASGGVDFDIRGDLSISINALEMSSDGTLLFAGRGNRLFVYNLLDGRLAGELTDPDLGIELQAQAAPGPSKKMHVAHADLVNSLALSPDGRHLVSGDFRMIRIWRRLDPVVTDFTRNRFPGLISAWSSPGAPGEPVWAGDIFGNLGSVVFEGDDDPEIKFIQTHHAGAVMEIMVLSSDTQDAITLHSLDNQGTIYTWDTGPGHPFPEKPKSIHKSVLDVSAAMKIPRHNLFLVGTTDGTVAALQWADDQYRPIFSDQPMRGEITSLFLVRESEGILEICVSDSVGKLALCHLNISTWKMDIHWTRDYKVVQAASHGSSGLLAVNDFDGHIYILKSDDGSLIQSLNPDPDQFRVEKQTVRESKFMAGEIQFLEKRAEQLKSEANNQSERKTKAESDTNDKQNKYDLSRQEQDKIRSELEEFAKREMEARNEAVMAAATLAEARMILENRIEEVQQEFTNEVPLDRIGEILEEIARLGEIVGKQMQVSDSVQQTTEKLIGSIAEQTGPLEKQLGELMSQSAELRLALDLASRELMLATQALAQAVHRHESASQDLESARLLHQQLEDRVEADRITSQMAFQRVGGLAFSPSGSVLYSSDYRGYCVAWRMPDGSPLFRWESDSTPYFGLQIGGDGKALGFSGDGGIVRLDLEPGWQLEQKLGSAGGDSPFAERIYALDFTRDGSWLAVGGGASSRSGQIHVVDCTDWEVIRSMDSIHSDVVFGLEFSHDGRYLASSSADKYVRVTNVESGELIHSFEGHSHYVMDVSWHRNQRHIVSAGADGLIKVWDLLNKTGIRDIRASGKEVTAVSYFPYDSRLISSTGDPKVVVYQEDGKSLRELAGAEDYLARVAHDSNARLAAAAGQDGVVHVWDIQTGERLYSFPSVP